VSAAVNFLDAKTSPTIILLHLLLLLLLLLLSPTPMNNTFRSNGVTDILSICPFGEEEIKAATADHRTSGESASPTDVESSPTSDSTRCLFDLYPLHPAL
jgi:hypothetical protein